jgi:hypothetical protein
VSSRVGKFDGDEEGVAVAEVAGPALSVGGIVAVAVAAAAAYLLHLRMAGYFPFAVGPEPGFAGLGRRLTAFLAADPQRKGWRASGP